MEPVRAELDYFLTLTGMVVRDGLRNRVSFIVFVAMMFANNVVYFAMWSIYFYNFSSLRGWTLQDFATLQGIACFGFGLAFFFCGGSWNISRLITTGGLDSYLGRPRDVLMPVLFSECRASALGDFASSFVLWMVFGKHGLADLPILMLMSGAAAILFLAVMISLQSLSFWLGGLGSTTDTLYEVFITLVLYPQKIYGLGFQLVLFTLVPAAYIGLLPVEIMRHFSWPLLCAVVAAAVTYFLIATSLFNCGLRSYTSGNMLQR